MISHAGTRVLPEPFPELFLYTWNTQVAFFFLFRKLGHWSMFWISSPCVWPMFVYTEWWSPSIVHALFVIHRCGNNLTFWYKDDISCTYSLSPSLPDTYTCTSVTIKKQKQHLISSIWYIVQKKANPKTCQFTLHMNIMHLLVARRTSLRLRRHFHRIHHQVLLKS